MFLIAAVKTQSLKKLEPGCKVPQSLQLNTFSHVKERMKAQ